jgi:putative ABC transport system permease protein
MLRQIAAITLMNVRNIPSRWSSSLVLVMAVAGASSVFIGVVALATSFGEAIHGSARAERVIVLGAGAKSESGGTISRDVASFLESGPGIRSDGSNLVLAKEIVMAVTLPLSPDGTLGEITLRGTAQNVLVTRPEVRLVEGRMFNPGTKEVVLGRLAGSILADKPRLGGFITFRNDEWQVVGVFESNGDMHESEIWADAETVASLFKRISFQSVTVMLNGKSDVERFRSFVSSNPQATVTVWSEKEYLEQQSKRLNALLGGVAFVAGTIMALGAVLATTNAMLTAVAARRREIGVLATLGFGHGPVVVSMLVEAWLLTFCGAVIGALLTAGLFANAGTASTVVGGATKVVVDLQITAGQLSLSIALACLVAMVGCIAPAVRTRSIAVSSLLKAT